MSIIEKQLKVSNQITDLKYKLAHPEHFNLTEMERNRSLRQLKTLTDVMDKLSRIHTSNQSLQVYDSCPNCAHTICAVSGGCLKHYR